MRLRFLQCEIDVGERILTRAGRRVSLQPKALDVLVYLSRHSGRVIPTEELLDQVWQDVRVTPGSVSRAVHAARRAIGDDGGRQATIQTLRGRGFRFVAQVETDANRHPLPADVAYIGRRALLAEIRESLDAVASGHGPKLILLHGEAGVGKTRTVREIASWAESVGFQIREEQVRVTDPPFASWDRLTDAAQASEAFGAPRADLVSHLEMLQKFLRASTREVPLLITLDDLHFGGPENLELLDALGQASGRGRWAILSTSRTPTRAPQPESEARIESHALAGLEVADVPGFARAHRRPLSDRLCRELHSHASGNPLHLRDLLALTTEAVSERFTAIAESFEDLVSARLNSLDTSARDLVEWAAIAGDGSAAELVAEAAEITPLEVVELRGPAEAAGFFQPARGGMTAERAPLAFRHDRVREAVYDAIPPLERARRHWRIAEWLERSHAEALGPVLEALALHWSRAAPIAPAGLAAEFCLRAGRLAEAAHQMRRSGHFYADAVRLLGETDCPDPALVVAANLGRARNARAAGDWGTSVSSARAALAAMAEPADDRGLADDRGRADAFGEAAWLAAGPTMPYRPDASPDPNPLLREALAKLHPDSVALRTRLSMRLAASLSEPAAQEERAILRHQALTLARNIGQPGLLAEVLVEPYAGIGLALEPAELEALTDGLLAESDLATEVRVRLLRIGAALDRGNLAGVESELAALGQRADAHEEPFAGYWVALVSATLAMARGEFGLAEAHSQAALSLGERIGLPLAYPHFNSQMMALRVFEGRGEELRFLVAEHLARSANPTSWAQTAWFYCETGEPEKARPIFERWMKAGLGDLRHDESWRFNAAVAARVAAALGETRFAEPLLRQLTSLPVDVLRRGYMIGYGPKQAYMGLLHALLQEDALAAACFDRAYQLAAGAGATAWCDAIVTWRGGA